MNTTQSPVIAAISGGVDSVVMLDMLAGDKRKLLPDHPRVIVAHVDHGMRPESGADARFVMELAGFYSLPFELGKLGLGDTASEETARQGRHSFLRKVSDKYGKAPIVTAHHQDDVLETAAINVLRGTGRHGLSSLRTDERYLRPLLDWTREHIYQYATDYRLEWVEDETNETDRFLRNRIRHHLIPRMRRTGANQKLLDIGQWFHDHNAEIDRLLDELLGQLTEHTSSHVALDRKLFGQLPAQIQAAIIHQLLRQLQVRELDSQLVSDVTAFARDTTPGKRLLQATPLQIIQTPEWTLFEPSY